MTENSIQEIMEILEMNLNSKDMTVLSALLKSQEDPKMYVDFDMIRTQLEVEEGGKKGKDSLVYRSLSTLEQLGFLQVDRSGHRHGYNSNVMLLHNVFRNAIRERTKSFEKVLSELDMKIQTVSDINPEHLQGDLIGVLMGEKEFDKPVFAEGWENILHLLDEKIYKNLKRGDIVRITVEWLYKFDELTPSRIKFIENLLKKGVNFRGVEHVHGKAEGIEARKEVLKKWIERGYNPMYRITPRADSTYQLVARNGEGIVLIVSESPLSATWLPRESNPDLVDNALSSFDADFERGSDILEIEEDLD